MTDGLVRLREHINGTTTCFLFDWERTGDEVRERLLEQLGPDGQHRVLDRSLVPFAVLGDTEESGEELSLEAVLDTQFDGVLLHDSADQVYLDDEGTLRALHQSVRVFRESGDPV